MTRVHELWVTEGDVVLVGVDHLVPAFNATKVDDIRIQGRFDKVTEATGMHFVVVPGLKQIKAVKQEQLEPKVEGGL